MNSPRMEFRKRVASHTAPPLGSRIRNDRNPLKSILQLKQINTDMLDHFTDAEIKVVYHIGQAF